MMIKELELASCLSSQEYDPSPHRVDPSETPVSYRRDLPILYECDSCNYKVSFGIEDFRKHHSSDFSNLDNVDRDSFVEFEKTLEEKSNSFIDFYCPTCKQPTTILFISGNSGYWGEFFFKILRVLVLKK